jgi:toxin ParE1/3/4
VSLELVWSPLARRRLEQIHDYVAQDKPEAAKRLGARIVAVVELLKDHPYLGRIGAEPRVRELVIGGTPYIVLYRVRRGQIRINTIWHGAREKPKSKSGN